ncbi:MAG: N-acetyl-gamma-glutamyl-phosphate reductase [Bacteroidia bacterium]
MHKKRVAIIGATGYTGSELVGILKNHDKVEIALITSESRAGEKFSDVHRSFQGIVDDRLGKAEQIDQAEADLVFLALPHGISMEYVRRFAQKKFRIVDLSGDFRLSSPAMYTEWYQKDHTYKEGFEQAAYGLPELFRDEVKNARLVANPGCYPTSAILALAPLCKSNMLKTSTIIVDAKSGITGAGIKAKPVTHYSNVSDNFQAYGIKTHRHTIEIQNTLEELTGDMPPIQFTPHLLPVDRGILSTIYAQPAEKTSREKLNALYKDFYQNEPFVRITENPPAIKEVRGSNYCNIYVDYDERTNNIILISVIDNLVKGAAGQAVQNMNIMLGFSEHEGLHQIPMNP